MKIRVAVLATIVFATCAHAGALWVSPDDGSLHARLPAVLRVHGAVVYPATQSACEAEGWRMETEAESEARESAEEAARHAMPLNFTKRDLCKVLAETGYLAQFRAALAADEQAAFWWDTCVELATDDPDFMEAVDAMKIALGVTDRDVRAICERAAGW